MRTLHLEPVGQKDPGLRGASEVGAGLVGLSSRPGVWTNPSVGSELTCGTPPAGAHREAGCPRCGRLSQVASRVLDEPCGPRAATESCAWKPSSQILKPAL